MEKQSSNKQTIKIEDRERLEINGVESMLGFDEDYITLSSTLGKIIIEGENLTVIDLSQESGKIIISGKIISVSYEDTKIKKQRGIFG